MGRRQRLGNVGAGAEAGIGEAFTFQAFQSVSVSACPLRLDENRLVPVESEPAQVLEDAVDELRTGAGLVEILDAHAELAAAVPRPMMADRRTVGMAEMQPPRRGRCKARDDHVDCCQMDS